MLDGSILTRASREWAARPEDERFTTLTALHARVEDARLNSQAKAVSSRSIEFAPDPEDSRNGLLVNGAAATHWSFGQVATLAGAPAGYLRKLPPALAADNLNYGLRFERDVQDIGVLLSRDPESGSVALRAATGPNYGRIWNADITRSLIDKFGDGVSGDWTVPGEFGKAVEVSKDNTTLYASDRDMFVFLADEKNRIEIANRRNGEPGSLARGFFVWNSEVGSATLGIAAFLFDYVCMNRIVWGVQEYREVKIRHTSGAPDRWIEDAQPVLEAYARSSAKPFEDALRLAQESRLDDVDKFLAKRNFSARDVTRFKAAHMAEEGRPIETLWDATTAITAVARTIGHADERVKMERAGGAILDLVAA